MHWFPECPGFSWDRVNFHKKPGGDTAGPADPNWPDNPGIRYRVPSCSMRSWGAARECAGHRAVREMLYVFPWGFLDALLISIISVTVCFLCCSVKLPLSQLTSLPFSSHSSPCRSGGRGDRAAMWSFVAGRGQTTTLGFLSGGGKKCRRKSLM